MFTTTPFASNSTSHRQCSYSRICNYKVKALRGQYQTPFLLHASRQIKRINWKYLPASALLS
eukprot:c31183_g1_i1 orf=3-185(-)